MSLRIRIDPKRATSAARHSDPVYRRDTNRLCASPAKLAVELVDEDTQGKRVVDGLVEPLQQLVQALATAADQSGIGKFVISGRSDTARIETPDCDPAVVVDQLLDAGKQQLRCRILAPGFVCGSVSGRTPRARLHEINPSKR